MANRDELLAALKPILDVVKTIDPNAADAEAKLESALPAGGEVISRIRALVREGVTAGWLCDRENAGIRFSRVQKADVSGYSIDAVHMDKGGGEHTHPSGEVDLCFAVSGDPRFDGRAPGWVIYAANTWHVPTVTGGAMDILYFLPGGAIQFGPKPSGAVAVGIS